ncbi:MAG: class I SAM-dependent methyltransferase [Alphaproteobacteria bacterium]
MDSEVLKKLRALPRLAADAPSPHGIACKACGGAVRFFDIVDFQKCCSIERPYAFGISGIPVPYFRCTHCRFVQTNFLDDWTEHDFREFIYNADYVKVDPEYELVRPEQQALRLSQVLSRLRSCRILDYGSGTGLLRERLASLGFTQVENFDPFSSPARPSGTFEIITCVEVLEHSVEPRRTIEDIASLLAPGGCVLFSTGIQPANIDELRANWWYIGPRNGHISIFSIESLAILAQRCGLVLYGGQGDMAFGPVDPKGEIAALLATIGRRHVVLSLASPDNGLRSTRGSADVESDPSSWHSVESGDAGRFRWSRSSRVSWTFGAAIRPPCTVEVLCPFTMEIRPGFASGCRIALGKNSAPVTVEGKTIVARLQVDDVVEPTITLETPATVRPSELRDSVDRRELGLAIPVAHHS